MKVNSQKYIEFKSQNDCLFDATDLRKAILWYSKKPVTKFKHIFLHGRYYAISIYDKKIHIHRLLMMYWLKRDLERNEYVHHKNKNRFNNLKDNLELLPASIHQSITNKNRIHTEEHNHKIGVANSKRKGMKYNKIYETPELIKNEV